MNPTENEDQLKSAALQTAKSVLATKKAAEQELINAKEKLELKAQELANSLAIMRATLESTSDGILVTGGLRTIMNFNQKYLTMFNIPSEMLDAGDNMKRREFVSRQFDDPEKFLARNIEIIESAVPESFDVLEFSDGRVYERYSKLLDNNNTELGRVWSFHDITKQREEENKQKQAKIEAEIRTQRGADFMALLSHELRTPLTPVLMTATALKEDENIPAEVREQFEMMERNIAIEVRMIDDLLDITSVQYKKLQLITQPCDAHSLIGSAIEIVRDAADAKNISIERDFSAKRTGIMADPARFQQIIWNLLRNAIKFTPHGGHILISTRDQEDNWLHIEVTDTGIGMEAKDLDKIFLPLEQLEIVRERRYGGLGLGLAIVRSMVELHGGKTSAKSEGPDRGATFIVEFPGATAPPPDFAGISPIQSSSLPSGPPLRLLLVDDHPSTLLAVSTLLTRDGHKVITASTVTAALAPASVNTFDLLISDLGLPDGTGNQLMEELRDKYGLQGIAMSGYGTEADIERSLESGFAVHLVKPVPMAELRRVLAQLGSSK